jgi:PAS domain S-box-containing protein
MYQLLGYHPDEAPPTAEWWFEQVHPDDLPRLLDNRDRLDEGTERTVTEYRVRHRDGHYIHVIDRSIADIRHGLKVERYVGCTQDVTEIRQAEEALREADRRKDEFLAVLAHEIRNPLASIRNSLRLMKPGQSSEPGPVDIERDRAMAERQVAHLARLIDDLMDVSRISRGLIELRREPIELANVLRTAIDAAKSPLEERGHHLTVALPDRPIPLQADPTRLEQVFGNLLNNAIKYTSPGGEIRVSAEVVGAEVAVKVTDSGLGIDAEMLPKVFGMFVQDGKHLGHSQGGLGIGLGLSRSLIDLHGGRIWASSDGPGQGSEFEVRLPLADRISTVEDHPSTNGQMAPATQPLRKRILVIDDNEDIAVSLCRLLSRIYGHEVRIAHDGPSALELADTFHPEIVLLDIGLPEMDGCEVARRLRERPEFADTLLVALTGWGQEADRKRSQDAGIDHHLVKPVDPDALADLIAGEVKV